MKRANKKTSKESIPKNKQRRLRAISLQGRSNREKSNIAIALLEIFKFERTLIFRIFVAPIIFSSTVNI